MLCPASVCPIISPRVKAYVLKPAANYGLLLLVEGIPVGFLMQLIFSVHGAPAPRIIAWRATNGRILPSTVASKSGCLAQLRSLWQAIRFMCRQARRWLIECCHIERGCYFIRHPPARWTRELNPTQALNIICILQRSSLSNGCCRPKLNSMTCQKSMSRIPGIWRSLKARRLICCEQVAVTIVAGPIRSIVTWPGDGTQVADILRWKPLQRHSRISFSIFTNNTPKIFFVFPAGSGYGLTEKSFYSPPEISCTPRLVLFTVSLLLRTIPKCWAC